MRIVAAFLSLLVACATHAGAKVYTVTGYCACKRCTGQWSGGPTASGKMPVEGVTVAGPRRIPFGTKIEIAGVGFRVIEDRLAKRYDNRFDIFFKSHQDALNFGIRRLKVKIQ